MDSKTDDHDLLDRYGKRHDEAAFRELVLRHLNLVYSAACRRVGDGHMAEDVTQAVFMILAQKANAARRVTPLSRWLLATVRYAAANALKIERRRRRHEAAAGAAASRAVGGCSPNPADVLVWQEVALELDDAVLKLSAADRTAVLLRFFEQKPVSAVAVALGVTEAAAGMRVVRAVAKLRKRLGRGGTVLTLDGAAGLEALLAANAVCAASAGLWTSTVAAIGGAAGGGTTSAAIAKGAMTMMAWSKLKAAAAVTVAATVIGTGAVLLDRPAGHVRAAVAVTGQVADESERALAALLKRLERRSNEVFGDGVALIVERPIDLNGDPSAAVGTLHLIARAGDKVSANRYLVGSIPGRYDKGRRVPLPPGWPEPHPKDALRLFASATPLELYVTDGTVDWPGDSDAPGVVRVYESPRLRPRPDFHANLPHRLWPDPFDGGGELLPTDDKRPGLIGLRITRDVADEGGGSEAIYWLDPNRDDLIVERITRNLAPKDPANMAAQSGSVTTYSDFAQLPNGQWFPKQWRVHETRRSRFGVVEESRHVYGLYVFPGHNADPSWFTHPVARVRATTAPAPR